VTRSRVEVRGGVTAVGGRWLPLAWPPDQVQHARLATRETRMQKIHPFLWFDGQAEEAAKFYVSVFENGRIIDVMRWSMDGPHSRKGDVLTVDFEIAGQRFSALNGGPELKPTPAISFFVDVQTQGELDTLWDRLLEGGKPMQCGWLTDRFGIAWQIVPEQLGRLMRDPDVAKARRTTEAMMKMVKLDIAELTRAHDGA
jgi:predicted 3-demethylubiquinone-9 3-methyltransferase (glyoxalase superfamily)